MLQFDDDGDDNVTMMTITLTVMTTTMPPLETSSDSGHSLKNLLLNNAVSPRICCSLTSGSHWASLSPRRCWGTCPQSVEVGNSNNDNER